MYLRRMRGSKKGVGRKGKKAPRTKIVNKREGKKERRLLDSRYRIPHQSITKV